MEPSQSRADYLTFSDAERRARSFTTTNHPTAATAPAITAFWNTPTDASTTCHRSPNWYPATISNEFHTRLPSAVRGRNSRTRMRSTPAGTEIRLRTTGTNRPISTALAPCRSNQSLALSTSCTFTSGSLLASVLVRSRPSTAPTPYNASAPTTDPSVVKTIALTSPSSPRLAANPASGRITSLGHGGNKFSSATASPAPAETDPPARPGPRPPRLPAAPSDRSPTRPRHRSVPPLPAVRSSSPDS